MAKNGKVMATWDKIYQAYFCPAVSLYNFAHVEFHLKREEMRYLPEGFIPYMDIYDEEIQYENLKSKKIFSNFVID